jgi:hypothetical protein
MNLQKPVVNTVETFSHLQGRLRRLTTEDNLTKLFENKNSISGFVTNLFST